jgi:hypothetical protein
MPAEQSISERSIISSSVRPAARNLPPMDSVQADSSSDMSVSTDSIASAPFPTLKANEIDMILDDYQSSYGAATDHPIISQLKGEPTPSFSTDRPSRHQLYSSCKLKPRSDAYFRVKEHELELEDMMLFLLHEDQDFLSPMDWDSLAKLDDGFSLVISEAKRLRYLDFRPLRNPRYDYADQQEISQARVDMATAAMFAYRGDPAMLVRFIDGEHTASYRDVHQCLKKIEPHVEKKDYDDIERIFTRGCPLRMDIEMPKAEKRRMMARANQPSVDDNLDVVRSTMNKEERYSHVIVLAIYLCRFSPFLNHVPQGVNEKEGKFRLVWDGTTKLLEDDIVMNDITSTDGEPDITFGETKMKALSYLWNTRISYPTDDIKMAYADIAACFRIPKIVPELTGAFGFMIPPMGLYFLATAMVFGSLVSAACWEPMRRAIEVMTTVYFASFPGNTSKHNDLLSQIIWEPPAP